MTGRDEELALERLAIEELRERALKHLRARNYEQAAHVLAERRAAERHVLRLEREESSQR